MSENLKELNRILTEDNEKIVSDCLKAIRRKNEEIEKLKAENAELKNLILEQDHKLQKIVSSAGIEKIEIFPNGEKITKLTRQVEILKKAMDEIVNAPEVSRDSYESFKIMIRAARKSLQECEGIE